MASGIALGGLAQGLASGLQTGFGIGRAVREKERFDLERPALEAAAEKGKQELAFQKDYAEKLKGLYADAAGGEVQAEDGTIIQKPPMSPVEMEVRAADLMKQSMVSAGLMDFKRLAEARQYSKMIEEEGVMAAMDYAIKNPNDQEGIRKMFNSTGKVKMGEDITIGIENGQFGSKVVGTRVGANGKVEKVFDGADLLRPYISAGTYAQMQNQKDIAAGREVGENARNERSSGVQLQLGQMRERGARANLEYQENREDARVRVAAARADQDAVLKIAGENVQTNGRSLTVKEDITFFTNLNREAGSLASQMVADPTDKFYRKPQAAFDAAYKITANNYGVNLDAPTFPSLGKKK